MSANSKLYISPPTVWSLKSIPQNPPPSRTKENARLLLLLLLRSPARSLGFTILSEIFPMWPFSTPLGSHIPSSWMVHAGCLLVASIHLSRTRMSGSLESVRWNACVHRLHLSLYSYPKEFGGMESEPMSTPRKKSPPLEKFSQEEDRTHDAASSRTASSTHNQRAIPTPCPCL